MTKRQDRDVIYLNRHFDAEIILYCVRWYVAHRIHKHQFSFGRGRPRSDRSLRTDWERALA